MTVTLSSDGSTLTFTSTLLAGSAGKTIIGLTLKTKLNCSSTSTSVVLTSLIPSISNSTFSLPSTTYYGDVTKTTYCDGIYGLELDVTYNIDNGTTVEQFLGKESACKFIDTLVKCDVITYYNNTKNSTALFYYNALKISGDCDSCSCAELCSLYNELKTLIGNGTNNSTTDTSCGCS